MSKEEVKIEENLVEKELYAIKAMLDENNYALMGSLQAMSSEIYKAKTINRDAIRKAISNPYANIKTLQNASMVLKANNGIYARIINYLSSMLTYDYILYPLNVDSFKNSKQMQKAYNETALFLEMLNIKHNSHWFAKRIIEQGELYLYKQMDSNGVLYQEIPCDYCKIVGMENNVLRYAINLSTISGDILRAMPKEIQNLVKRFKDGKIPKAQLVDRNWYELGDNAVAFNIDRFSSKGIPMFSHLFDDLAELEAMKEIYSRNAIIDNIKLIHQKLPIDKETGRVLMDFSVATAYHNSTKANLPKGTAITTSPLDLSALTLDSANKKLRNEVDDVTRMIFDGAGISAEIFNGERATNEAIAKGVLTDSLMVYTIQEMIQDYINWELLKLHKNNKWQIQFVGTTIFNKDEYVRRAKDNMAFGGSRMEFMACSGYTPLQARSILMTEKLLGYQDELLVPAQSAHTSSSKNEVGTPTKENTEKSSGQNSNMREKTSD